MEFNFIRNIQFTKLIKVEGRLKEFNFRKPNGKQEGDFTVDVIDERGNRIMFTMRKTDSDWKITTPDVPAWISTSEPVFRELIDAELKTL